MMILSWDLFRVKANSSMILKFRVSTDEQIKKSRFIKNNAKDRLIYDQVKVLFCTQTLDPTK